jgi:hypothetical protein
MIKLKLDRKKLLFINLIVFIFGLLSFFFIFFPETLKSSLFRSEIIIRIIGVIGFPMSFLVSISYVIKLFDKNVGLVITDDFLVDNTVYESNGKIFWQDIFDVHKTKNNFELILSDKAQKTRNNELNSLKKIILIIKHWQYKDKIFINSSTLKCTKAELEKYIYTAWRNSKLIENTEKLTQLCED